jgi:hypothetical protein
MVMPDKKHLASANPTSPRFFLVYWEHSSIAVFRNKTTGKQLFRHSNIYLNKNSYWHLLRKISESLFPLLPDVFGFADSPNLRKSTGIPYKP